MNLLFEGSAIWGIDPTPFAVGYAVALVGLSLVGLLVRLAVRSTRGPRPPHEPEAAEIAVLNAGPDRAVQASLAALRQARVIDVRSESQLLVTGLPPSGMSTMDRSVYAAIRRDVPANQLVRSTEVVEEITRTRTNLLAAGWLLSDHTRRRLRFAAIPVVLLGLIGLVRIGFVLAAASTVGPLLVLVAVTGVAAWSLARPATVSRTGRRMLTSLRREYQHLAPAQNPDWAAYGPRGAAVAVALFGPTVLAGVG